MTDVQERMPGDTGHLQWETIGDSRKTYRHMADRNTPHLPPSTSPAFHQSWRR